MVQKSGNPYPSVTKIPTRSGPHALSGGNSKTYYKARATSTYLYTRFFVFFKCFHSYYTNVFHINTTNKTATLDVLFQIDEHTTRSSDHRSDYLLYSNTPYRTRVELHCNVPRLTIPYHAIPHQYGTESCHVLHRTISYHIILYRTAPYRAILYGIALYLSVAFKIRAFCDILHRTIPPRTAYTTGHTVPCRIIPYHTTQHSCVAIHCTVGQNGAASYCTIQTTPSRHCTEACQAKQYGTAMCGSLPYNMVLSYTIPYHAIP